MGINAIALVRVQGISSAVGGGVVQVTPLEDGALLHTGESFGTEPAVLALTVRALLGDVLERQHLDPRGIFFIPDVAAPRARTYEAVIAEVGAGGVWGPLPSVLGEAGEGAGGVGALLGNLLGQMPSSLLAVAQAAAQGDASALRDVSARMQALMASSPALQGLAPGTRADPAPDKPKK